MMNIEPRRSQSRAHRLLAAAVLFSLMVPAASWTQDTIPPDKEMLLKGEPMGQGLVAERNGFPFPQKILSYKEQLGLTKDQVRKMDEMLKNLPITAAVQGQDIVEAEEDLNTYFASGTVTEKTLRTKLERIGKLRAGLRFTHLQVYVKAKQILSGNQWQRLQELMGSESKQAEK
jgi:Spy/CpxP family protein refolding chaperone